MLQRAAPERKKVKFSRREAQSLSVIMLLAVKRFKAKVLGSVYENVRSVLYVSPLRSVKPSPKSTGELGRGDVVVRALAVRK